MSKESQKQQLLSAVNSLRIAERLLMQASRDSTDPVILASINSEYTQLDSFLSQIMHCIAIADDNVFADASAALKKQAMTVQAREEDFKRIAAGVNTAAQIVGCIGEALAFIAKI